MWYLSTVRCPFCGHEEDRVVDTRESGEGSIVRRRRACLKCDKRFTTYERIEEIPFMVVKKSGRREPFDRAKVMTGLLMAFRKRPVPTPTLEKIVDQAERKLARNADREMPSRDIGRLVMNRLRKIDKVAYLRFASVYLEFEDVGEFAKVIDQLLGKRDRSRETSNG